MPYISPEHRALLVQKVDNLVHDAAIMAPEPTDRAGVLNYVCTTLALKLYPQRKYWVLALVVGVFVTVVLEYYRRWAAPYEDQKITENGDVYP